MSYFYRHAPPPTDPLLRSCGKGCAVANADWTATDWSPAVVAHLFDPKAWPHHMMMLFGHCIKLEQNYRDMQKQIDLLTEQTRNTIKDLRALQGRSAGAQTVFDSLPELGVEKAPDENSSVATPPAPLQSMERVDKLRLNRPALVHLKSMLKGVTPDKFEEIVPQLHSHIAQNLCDENDMMACTRILIDKGLSDPSLSPALAKFFLQLKEANLVLTEWEPPSSSSDKPYDGESDSKTQPAPSTSGQKRPSRRSFYGCVMTHMAWDAEGYRVEPPSNAPVFDEEAEIIRKRRLANAVVLNGELYNVGFLSSINFTLLLIIDDCRSVLPDDPSYEFAQLQERNEGPIPRGSLEDSILVLCALLPVVAKKLATVDPKKYLDVLKEIAKIRSSAFVRDALATKLEGLVADPIVVDAKKAAENALAPPVSGPQPSAPDKSAKPTGAPGKSADPTGTPKRSLRSPLSPEATRAWAPSA